MATLPAVIVMGFAEKVPECGNSNLFGSVQHFHHFCSAASAPTGNPPPMISQSSKNQVLHRIFLSTAIVYPKSYYFIKTNKALLRRVQA